jgi:alpha-beta hydrolase superfamily lysophospholipase
VHILAHSMGAWLAIEALRENAISGSPDLNGKLGDVMLAAPDIDLNVFRQQLARLDPSHSSSSSPPTIVRFRYRARSRATGSVSARSTPIIPAIAWRSKTLASRPTIFRASRSV